MKRYRRQIVLGISLVAISVFFYLVHYAIFRNSHHIFLYLIGDLAFLPIQVLFVTLIIDELLSERERRDMLKKTNMAIGTFFSQVGTELLRLFSGFNPESDEIRKNLLVTNEWSEKEFAEVSKRIKNHDYAVNSINGNLESLRSFLIGERDFLLRLLGNPNLLEHESFTDLLWAVFHLTDELAHRKDVKNLSDADYEHLSIDIKRAYTQLISEWLSYMKHLKKDYPYLFSLAIRTNPFDLNASAEVR